MKEVLLAHIKAHPRLLPQDAVKLCYQSAFGGGHLITDPARAAAYLRTERASLTQNPTQSLSEDIGGGMVRLHLASAAAQTLSDDVILRVFAASAARVLSRDDNDRRFAEALASLEALAQDGQTPFTAQELSGYLADYRAAGCPVVSHTPEYRTAYTPAYRVMERFYLPLLPIIARIDALLAAHPERTVIVAIDGHAASGKTTAADALSALYVCNVFHMDDYFLPFDLRTPQRLAEPGGNVDYERFRSEVLDGILSGKPFAHAAFDCGTGKFLPPVTKTPKPLAIVEGSYAHHPHFGNRSDLKIAVDITPEEQQKRILARNGPAMLRMFTDRWIPMEHRYFEAFDIFGNADIVIGKETPQ